MPLQLPEGPIRRSQWGEQKHGARLDAVSEFPLASSIGVTFVRRYGFDYTRSLGEADKALYYGKQTGKHQFFFYEDLPAD